MKTINILICLLIIMGGIASAEQGGSKFGPPPEAYAACKVKKAGDSASFVNPKGETIKGTCAEDNGKMVLRPDSNKGHKSTKLN